jgi:hypothetical protein
MCIGIVWHEVEQGERKCLPDSQRRVLVAQDDGYIEMAYWDGTSFQFDWPTMLDAKIPRGKYWCDLPEPPTENSK